MNRMIAWQCCRRGNRHAATGTAWCALNVGHSFICAPWHRYHVKGSPGSEAFCSTHRYARGCQLNNSIQGGSPNCLVWPPYLRIHQLRVTSIPTEWAMHLVYTHVSPSQPMKASCSWGLLTGHEADGSCNCRNTIHVIRSAVMRFNIL